jgi:hypothetical protein
VKGVSRKAQHAKADPLANSIIASIEGAMFVSRIEVLRQPSHGCAVLYEESSSVTGSILAPK